MKSTGVIFTNGSEPGVKVELGLKAKK
jgi:hypothetical protein